MQRPTKAGIVVLFSLCFLIGGSWIVQAEGNPDFNDTNCDLVFPNELSENPRKYRGKQIYIIIQPTPINVSPPPKVRIRKAREIDSKYPILVAVHRSQIGPIRKGILSVRNKKRNVKLFGKVTNDLRAFVVHNLEISGTDEELYGAEIESLKEEGDMEELRSYGDRLVKFGESLENNSLLINLGEQAVSLSLELIEAKAPKDDYIKQLKLARDWLASGNRERSLAACLRVLEVKENLPGAFRVMEQINAVPYEGTWILFEEFKKREGFVQRDGEWISKQLINFRSIADKRLANPDKTNPRNFLIPKAIEARINQGTLQAGMDKIETAKSLGFPDTVRTLEISNRLFEEWGYGKRGNVYFVYRFFRGSSGPILFKVVKNK